MTAGAYAAFDHEMNNKADQALNQAEALLHGLMDASPLVNVLAIENPEGADSRTPSSPLEIQA